MEKKQYLKPETNVYRMETQMMIAQSPHLTIEEGEALPDVETLSNKGLFTDIWGNEP